jgi:hypothetical protein
MAVCLISMNLRVVVILAITPTVLVYLSCVLFTVAMHPSTITRIDAELLQSERELAQLLGLGSRGLLNASLSDTAGIDERHNKLVSEINKNLMLEMAELSIKAEPSAVSATHENDGTKRSYSELKWTVQLDAAVFRMCIEFCLWYGKTSGSVWSSGIMHFFKDLNMKDPAVPVPWELRFNEPKRVEAETKEGMGLEDVEIKTMRNVFDALYYVCIRMRPLLKVSCAYDRWQLEVRCITILAIPTTVEIASSIVRECGWEKRLPEARRKVNRVVTRFLRLSFSWLPW